MWLPRAVTRCPSALGAAPLSSPDARPGAATWPDERMTAAGRIPMFQRDPVRSGRSVPAEGLRRRGRSVHRRRRSVRGTTASACTCGSLRQRRGDRCTGSRPATTDRSLAGARRARSTGRVDASSSRRSRTNSRPGGHAASLKIAAGVDAPLMRRIGSELFDRAAAEQAHRPAARARLLEDPPLVCATRGVGRRTLAIVEDASIAAVLRGSARSSRS